MFPWSKEKRPSSVIDLQLNLGNSVVSSRLNAERVALIQEIDVLLGKKEEKDDPIRLLKLALLEEVRKFLVSFGADNYPSKAQITQFHEEIAETVNALNVAHDNKPWRGSNVNDIYSKYQHFKGAYERTLGFGVETTALALHQKVQWILNDFAAKAQTSNKENGFLLSTQQHSSNSNKG